MTKLATPETKISSALLDDTADQESEPKVEQSLPQSKLHPSAQKKLRSYKIIVLGESGVGKTCLSFRFCAGRFPLHSEAERQTPLRSPGTNLVSLSFCFY